jgi:hypothetical protein
LQKVGAQGLVVRSPEVDFDLVLDVKPQTGAERGVQPSTKEKCVHDAEKPHLLKVTLPRRSRV